MCVVSSVWAEIGTNMAAVCQCSLDVRWLISTLYLSQGQTGGLDERSLLTVGRVTIDLTLRSTGASSELHKQQITACRGGRSVFGHWGVSNTVLLLLCLLTDPNTSPLTDS